MRELPAWNLWIVCRVILPGVPGGSHLPPKRRLQLMPLCESEEGRPRPTVVRARTFAIQAEEPISDDKSKIVADRKFINIYEYHELHYWSHRLGVSRDELKRAVSKVGARADDVARQFGKPWRHSAALNEASRAAARRLGFRFEGVFHNYMIFRGRNRDTAWYSVLDDEWPEVRQIMERWLAPGKMEERGPSGRT
jgi:hypothetical protein